jgi:hypothetical protein
MLRLHELLAKTQPRSLEDLKVLIIYNPPPYPLSRTENVFCSVTINGTLQSARPNLWAFYGQHHQETPCQVSANTAP